MAEQNWFEPELEKLKRMYPYLSNEDLSTIFKRSISSIQHKASKLKLKKDKEVNSIIRGRNRGGENCCNWKGGKKRNKKGYILVLKKNYSPGSTSEYVLEHRYIMSEYLGRELTTNEIVHHINGVKSDNRIENLEIMSNSEHTILHHKGATRDVTAKINISNGAKNRRKKGMII